MADQSAMWNNVIIRAQQITPDTTNTLLLEDSFALLLEDGFEILLEA